MPLSGQQLILYRAGSLTLAFAPLIKTFTCETGIQVNDVALGSVDAGRQITAGGEACDLYAPADFLDIDLFLKPAGYADFNIVFARGRMVLAYSARGLAAKNLPPITGAADAHATPKAVADWYEILMRPGVTIGGGHPFLDPGAYRAPLMFQLAAEYYKRPNLYNELLKHMVIPSTDALIAGPGKEFDFQLIYEHNARALARKNPDYRYVELPAEIDLSDRAREAYYRQHAVVVLPGLGTTRGAKTITVPGAPVAWGITIMTKAPNRENAVKFLQRLLGAAGTESLRENGPSPISPAVVSFRDFARVPAPLRTLVKIARP